MPAWITNALGNIDDLLRNLSNHTAHVAQALPARGPLRSRCSDGHSQNRSRCERGYCNITLRPAAPIPHCSDNDTAAGAAFVSANNCSSAVALLRSYSIPCGFPLGALGVQLGGDNSLGAVCPLSCDICPREVASRGSGTSSRDDK